MPPKVGDKNRKMGDDFGSITVLLLCYIAIYCANDGRWQIICEKNHGVGEISILTIPP